MKVVDDKVIVNRDTLFTMLWETPVSKFASKHDIPEKEIRKVCNKYVIPLPSRGYWAKRRYKKKLKVPVLDKIDGGNPELVLKKKSFRENSVDPKVSLQEQVFPKKLVNPCDEAIALKNDIEERKPRLSRDREGIIESGRGVFDVAVSKSNMSRAIRIVDAFIKLSRELGYDLNLSGQTEICVDGQWLKVRIREKSKRVVVDSSSSWIETKLVLTGVLAFQIVDINYEREWKDGKVVRLEDSFHKIMPWLQKKAAELNLQKEESRKWQEEYRKRQEEENDRKALFQKEKDDFKFLLTLSEKVRWANEIRLLVKQTLEKGRVPVGFEGWQFDQWIRWAKAKADWCDPFVDFEDEILEGSDLLDCLAGKLST